MNKKFSTLLVSTLLACGTAFTAQAADPYVADANAGVNTFLKVGGTKYLGLKDGKLTIVDDATAGIATLQECIWTIEKVAFPSAGGGDPTYGYKLLHNQSGQYLSIKLQSNTETAINATEKTKPELEIEAGNTVWAWDGTNSLSVTANDSVYTIAGSSDLKSLTLYAHKKGENYTTTLSSLNITNAPIDKEASIVLNAANFNALTKGILYFNDNDVAGGQKNVLTDNKWTAVDARIGDYTVVNEEDGKVVTTGLAFNSKGDSVLYFYNQTTVAGYDNAWKEDKAKKNYLVVDNGYYDSPTNALFTLAADTLSFEPTDALAYVQPAYKDGSTVEEIEDADEAYEAAMKALDDKSSTVKINARTAKTGKHHPFAGAFTATYNYYTDVITLASLYQPAKIDVDVTLGAIIDETLATFKDESSAINKMAKSAKTFIGTTTEAKFATGKDADFKLVNAEIAKLTGDENKAKKAVADAFMAAIAGMKISSTGALSTDKYTAAAFVDGVTPLLYANDKDTEENLVPRKVVIRKLATVQVLTISGKNDANLDPKIQPYKSKPAAGGDAVIAEGIYYIKDMNTVDENGKANPNYGMFYDASPVNGTGLVKEAQAFNPYAQFVVTAAPAAAKGNYQFTCLADADAEGAGVVMKAGDNYVINGDTIALVAAGKLADVDKYMGSAHFTAAELKNNTFAIASASAVLKGETFAMLADSAITLSADEVAFKLIAGSEVDKQGYDEKLAYVPYAIMTEDSLVITRTADDKYLFTTYKEAERVNKPVYFRLLATGSESTYVLYDVTKDDEAKVGINVQDKTVIVAAEEALNDLFTVTAVEAPASYKTIGETAKIQVANGNLAINNDNQAVSVREGDLRAAYTADDFVFTLDTAKYEGAETYTYFITKEVADTKLIMWEATDSAKVENAAPYHSGLDTRILFRPLNKIEDDTLYVANLADLAKEDTVKNSTSYQFSFAQVSDDAADGYIMQSGDKYVAVANGVVVVTTDKENAATVQIETVEGPTANEAVAAAEVSVVGAQGAIIVKGAAGKVVTVANILGQTIANQVAVSDNVTIAAPAGVAIVTVDGEATKVVVK